MIDRIGGYSALPAMRPATPVNSDTPAAAPARVASVKPELSTLATVVRDMAAAPPVDAAKVDRIKTAIAAEAYPIDPVAIAGKMIDDVPNG